MKEYKKENIILLSNIHLIFDKLYNKNDVILNNLFILNNYKQDNKWINNKKNFYLSITIPEIPNNISEYFLNNTKDVNFIIKNELILQSEDEYNIISKIKFNNIKSNLLLQTIDKLNIIKIKNKIKLIKVNDNITNATFISNINVSLPYPIKSIVENFILDYYNKIINQTILHLSTK